MAGNLAEFNNYLRDTLRISDQSLRNAINNQGIESFNDLIDLTVKDVEKACARIRTPGGTIPNPRAAEENQPATIKNPGIQVSLQVEKRLMQLCYFCRHMHRIQRTVTAAQASLARLIQVWSLKDAEDAFESSTVPTPRTLTKVDEIRQVLEDIENALTIARGINGEPATSLCH